MNNHAIPPQRSKQRSAFFVSTKTTAFYNYASISNVGVMQNKEWREAFAVGLTETIKRLEPTRILFYGTIPAYYNFGGIEVMAFKSRSFRKKKGIENG